MPTLLVRRQMATDDLVMLLVCCVIEAGKGSPFPLISDLAFVKAFHFCENSASAVGFALTNLEVRILRHRVMGLQQNFHV